jgi:hypothetical protein
MLVFKNIPSEEDLSFESLHWWKMHHHQFPNLAKVARLSFQIPTTSATSERMWSDAGLILDHENVSMLVYMRALYHFEDRYKVEL